MIINKITNFFKYRFYLKAQIDRTLLKYPTSHIMESEVNKKKFLVDLLSRQIDLKFIEHALVIGCRNEQELDLLEEYGVKKVTGIDLISFDPRVIKMDMHKMSFKENTFDVIYASHVIEHSFEYRKVFSEMYRVAKDNCTVLIEVPINFSINNADRVDFKSAENMLSEFKKIGEIKNIHIKENKKVGDLENFDGTEIARVIFSIKKSA